jgi:hypothetical protein
MQLTLNPDEKLVEWKAFGKIVDLVDSRFFSQELSRNDFKKLNRYRILFKVLFLAFFSQYDISEVVRQLNNHFKLRNFCKIDGEIDYKKMMKWYSDPKSSQFLELALKTINKVSFSKIRRIKNIIIDSTDLQLDLKNQGKYFTKTFLENRDYKRAFSHCKGHYSGFKLTLAMEYETGRVLAILIHPGCPNDVKIFDEMMAELKKRRLLHFGQKIYCDRGFTSFNNIFIGINKYKVLPILFLKKNIPIETIKRKLNDPLSVFKKSGLDIKLHNKYKLLRKQIIELLSNWKDFRKLRWRIEKLYSFLKLELKLDKVHAYHAKPVEKNVYVNVLLSNLLFRFAGDDLREIEIIFR